jgi:hypothetical protein
MTNEKPVAKDLEFFDARSIFDLKAVSEGATAGATARRAEHEHEQRDRPLSISHFLLSTFHFLLFTFYFRVFTAECSVPLRP